MKDGRSELTLLLARRLAEAGYINIVEDDVTKEDILKQAKCYVRVRKDDKLEPVEFSKSKHSPGYELHEVAGRLFPELRSRVMEELKERAKELGANYLFVKSSCINYGEFFQYTISATPYAILTNEDLEEKILDKLYPDGAPRDVCNKLRYLDVCFEKIDFVDLYYNHFSTFTYKFDKLGDEERMSVLRRISKLKERNVKVDEWLSENHPTISERAAREGMIKNE